MDSEILKTAHREAEALRAELARNPAFQKLQQVQRLIDVYESFDAAKPSAYVPRPVRRPPVANARAGTKLAQVEKVVLDHLWDTGKRMSSGQLLPLLAERGIEMGGKVPSKTLASMLSNSQKLNNLKGYGYGPAEWGEKPSVKDQKNEAPTGHPEGASQVTREADTSPNESRSGQNLFG